MDIGRGGDWGEDFNELQRGEWNDFRLGKVCGQVSDGNGLSVSMGD